MFAKSLNPDSLHFMSLQYVTLIIIIKTWMEISNNKQEERCPWRNYATSNGYTCNEKCRKLQDDTELSYFISIPNL